jgi:hypothetical protein
MSTMTCEELSFLDLPACVLSLACRDLPVTPDFTSVSDGEYL